MITKSTRINTNLATNGLTPLLISRLDHPDAIAHLNLLKLIKAVYERHPRPKQLIVENDLPQKLKKLRKAEMARVPGSSIGQTDGNFTAQSPLHQHCLVNRAEQKSVRTEKIDRTGSFGPDRNRTELK